ncbi:MAG: ribose transporter permease [Ilumatobacteraceae bacterium]|jgi:D-xylose transport system permease protein|nr:ribose transporter permease [Ilumatobacteraceae bacterium]
MSTQPSIVDPRLIAARPGVKGAINDIGRKITQGELGNIPVVVALIGVWAYFWFENHRFISAGNLTNLMLQLAAGGTIAIGVVLVLLLGEIDLSVGAISGFAAAVMVVLNLRHGWPAWFAIVAALVVGGIVGLVQGFWVTRIRVPAFIVTLAGQLALTGGLLAVLGKTGSIYITNSTIISLGQTFYSDTTSWIVAIALAVAYVGFTLRDRAKRRSAGLVLAPARNVVFRLTMVVGGLLAATLVFVLDRGLPLVVVIFLGLVMIVDIVLRRTPFGRHVFAVGGNAEAARRAGINVKQIRLTIFIVASMLAAAGGVLAAARGTSVNQSSGQGTVLLYAVGAAVIGGTSLFGGRGTAWAALLGSLVIQSVDNGMALLNKSTNVRYIVTGAVLLVAVTIDAVARRGRTSAGRA